MTPEERFERLCLFLEAQFGSNINPIEKPRTVFKPTKNGDEASKGGVKNEEEDDEMAEESMQVAEAVALGRLASIGVPVPGVEI